MANFIKVTLPTGKQALIHVNQISHVEAFSPREIYVYLTGSMGKSLYLIMPLEDFEKLLQE